MGLDLGQNAEALISLLFSLCDKGLSPSNLGGYGAKNMIFSLRNLVEYVIIVQL